LSENHVRFPLKADIRQRHSRRLDSLLLTGIGDVRHRGTLHVAFPAQVVELRAAVQVQRLSQITKS
jgi:hypothetical protein